MPSQINIRSYNQILGDMIRAIIAGTTLNDINAGSVLLTLLEAAASTDFENSTAILNILQLLDIDAVANSDLDSRAADYGLTRNPAMKASGFVNIYNTNITVQSTSLYILEPAPIAGQTVLYVNNTTGWTQSGTLYIGRGTPNFEGPIAYSSITVFATYSQINLSSGLQNNHLSSEIVINSQGQPDRIINAGTIVVIPANDINPEVQYVTLLDATLPSGESEVLNIPVIAVLAGSLGNAGYNTITGFDTLPFPGAAVTNTTAFTNGSDLETDAELRNRIKTYPTTLARGTVSSIIAAVVGVSDTADNKQVVSATITEPVNIGDPSTLYIDDGTGFQPSFAGQSVDVLLGHANGTEEFLQLSNYPVTRPLIVNNGIAPFVLTAGSFLRVIVDGIAETVTFEDSEFVNIASATLAEIVAAINNTALTFTAALTNHSQNLILSPTVFSVERFQVSPLESTDNPLFYANTQLQFPTTEVSYIALFQNSDRLRSEAISATLVSDTFGSWNIAGPGDLSISIDGTPAQDRAFSIVSFPGASSFASLTIQDWVIAFNNAFAGLTAIATGAQTLSISSNKIGEGSSLSIVGGTYINNIFSNVPLSATGQTSQFLLNRQTGNLQILTTINPGDSITAGVADDRGFIISAPTTSGTYSISSDAFGRPSLMVVVPDATYAIRRSLSVPVAGLLNIQNPSGTVMRVMAPTIAMFQSVLPGDYLFIAQRTSSWLNVANTGLFKIFEKGGHTNPGTDTYVDVENVNVVVQSGITIQDSADIKAFTTDGYPQIFLGSYTNNAAADPITDFVNTLNSTLINVNASIFKTNSIKLTSNTELNGSIAIQVSSGPMVNVFAETNLQVGNPPLIANRVSSKDLVSYFRPTHPIATNVWLSRQTADDQKGILTANAIPSSYPFTAPYSEILQSTSMPLTNANVGYDDYILMTRGNNRGQFRSIYAFNPDATTDSVGTQENLARTVINHTVGDEFEIIEPIKLSATDTMVIVMDKDPTNETISINMARTGQVNSGDSTTFIPTTTSFSATDYDNQPGITFGNVTVWGTSVNKTNFADYTIWMRSHNWYVGGGLSQLGTQGAMIVRAAEYGENGNDLRFSLAYPSIASQSPSTLYQQTPSWSQLTYLYGSGAVRAVGLISGNTITVDGPYPAASTNFPNGFVATYTFTVTSANATAGAIYSNNGQNFTVSSTIVSGTTLVTQGHGAPLSSGTLTKVSGTGDTTITFSSVIVTGGTGNYYDYTFSAGTFGSVLVGDILSIQSSSGITTNYQGQFRVANVSGNTVRVYNPSATSGTTTIVNQNGILIFPLSGNDVNTIVSTVNAGEIVQLTAVGSGALTILKATQEEDSGTNLAYGYTPSQSYISLYDGINWVQSFENSDPNFLLKAPYLLQGAQPTIYSMDTAPNYGGVPNGELFKLIPITVQNIYHHFTQPALSQLPLVSNVSIADDRKNVQITSLQLGSAGAVEVVGGKANAVKEYMTVDSEVATDGSGSYMLARVAAFPDTFGMHDVVMLSNDKGVQRLSRLHSTDSISVTNSAGSFFEYNYKAKAANITSGTSFAISDVSSSYGRASGVVWRWTDTSNTIALANVNAGDLVYAYGTLSGWPQGNRVGLAGDGLTAGLPIIAVNVVPYSFDIVNPNGVAMSTTVVGTGTVQICPTPVIRWNLAHAANVLMSTITATSNNIVVNTVSPHYLDTGDSVNVMDSLFLPDGTYTSVVVYSPTQFSFTFSIANFTENSSGASIIKTGLTPTRYRLETIGMNGLVRLQRQDGQSPRFTDCGVAVDDYIVIGGSTFQSNNSGIFRVLAVDNTSLMLINASATDQLNTIVNFNNNNLEATWTANTNTVTGIAGTFKYVSVGDWVKQTTDSDSLYLEVLSMSPSTPDLATVITLGGNYSGSTAIASGVVYDESINYDKGVYLQNANDIAIYEGDAAFVGDTITVQNIINASWFQPVNIGTFDIVQVGTNATTYLPFVRVSNSSGIIQSNVLMSVAPSGLYLTESLANKFYSIRTVHRAAIDAIDQDNRAIYLPQWTRSYKFNVANRSSVTHMGKLGYDTDITIGIDGYLYYTGLLQTVQRVVDGFDPDIATYPGQRAVGGLIETLPPLIYPITIALTVTTNNGVNLSDVQNQMVSSIINYIEGLGVGEDVVLSQIIANLMSISGVASVVFTTPKPSTAIIAIGNNQKATISASDIGIS